MKLRKIKKLKNKLLNFQLIKTKTYKNLEFTNSVKIENIGFRLKKILRIIYKYHINNKQILFLNTPLKLNKKLQYLVKNTRHTVIPESFMKNGIIGNKNFSNNTKNLKLKLKKIPDLIIIVNKIPNNEIIKKLVKTKILTITLHSNLKNTKIPYKLIGNFKFIQKQIRNNLFYSLLFATLKIPFKTKII